MKKKLPNFTKIKSHWPNYDFEYLTISSAQSD
jgi:hypothetical protein